MMTLLPHSGAEYHRIDDPNKIAELSESIVVFLQHIGDAVKYEFGSTQAERSSIL